MRTPHSRASNSDFALWLAHLASQPATHSLDCPESADNVHYPVMVMVGTATLDLLGECH